MKKIKLTKLAVLTLMGLMLATSATAQFNYVLKVDISDPSAVTITATTNIYNGSTEVSTSGGDGAVLYGFFTGDSTASGPGTGSLEGGGSGDVYDSFSADTYSSSPQDLRLYASGKSDTQSFNSGSIPFTGTMTIDFSSISSQLPGVGTIGNVYAGYSGNPGTLLGQWEVIAAAPTPEPGALALAGLGGISACFFARRRK